MLFKRKLIAGALMGSLALAPLGGLTGCSNLPGGGKEQGAVGGGVGGALAGAAIAKDNRLLGALIGGALGAGGGYVIGAQVDKNKDNGDGDNSDFRDRAVESSRQAEREPADVEDVARSRTADLDDDGFVTLDEVVAMERAKLSDREMVQRLERTQQVFELTESQEQYLRARGVSDEVIDQMAGMNRDYLDSARTASGSADDYDRDNGSGRNVDYDRTDNRTDDRFDDRESDRFDRRSDRLDEGRYDSRDNYSDSDRY